MDAAAMRVRARDFAPAITLKKNDHMEETLMSRMNIPAQRPGGSLGAMMLALDLSPAQAAELWHGVPLARAVERCLLCPTATQCAAWLRDPHRDPSGYKNFCPNAGLLDIARRR
jgi:hypothetical protein